MADEKPILTMPDDPTDVGKSPEFDGTQTVWVEKADATHDHDADYAAAVHAHTGVYAPVVHTHTAGSVSFTSAGGIGATDVQAALVELDTEKATVTALNAHLADGTDAHAATAVGFTPAAGVAAVTVQAAIEEVAGGVTAHLGDTTAAHAASAVAFTPAGTIAATDVQAAVVEVASEAAAALAAHSADSTAQHGITDFAVLEALAGKVKFGTGTPEGALAAPVGTMYLRADGGAGTVLYVKETGTGNTGWVAK